jgi:hypothetical protein
MIELLDIMDRRWSTKVESNGFEPNEKILRYIAEHPEEVHQIDKNGYTPYHWILRYARYPASLLTYILPYVADPNVPRKTTVLGRKESPIVLLCQNTTRVQSMNTILSVYKDLGKELTIGGKETGEFKTVCDRDERIYPEPFVNSPFPPYNSEPVAPASNSSLPVTNPFKNNSGRKTKKQVAFGPVHVSPPLNSEPNSSNSNNSISVPNRRFTHPSKRGVSASTIRYQRQLTHVPTSTIRNQTQLTHVPTSPIRNQTQLTEVAAPNVPLINLLPDPVNLPSASSGISPNALPAVLPVASPIASSTIAPSTAHAGVGLNIPPVASTAGASTAGASTAGASAAGANPTPLLHPWTLQPHIRRKTPLPPPPSEEDVKIINTTKENIEIIKGIILPRLNFFIKTQLCKTIPAKYTGVLRRTLVTPETYAIKTSDEILNAAIQFILAQLGNMSQTIKDYQVIKKSFPSLGYSDSLIWSQLPSVAKVRAEMKQKQPNGDASKPTREADALDAIQKIIDTSTIKCTKEGLPDLTVYAIVKKVFNNINAFIDPHIFDSSTQTDRSLDTMRYYIIKIVNPIWSLNIKSKKLQKNTLAKKANLGKRRKAGETLSNRNSGILDTPDDAAIMTEEQVTQYWIILNVTKNNLDELRRLYSS